MRYNERGKKIPESYIECGYIDCSDCSFSCNTGVEVEKCGHFLGEEDWR